VSELASCFTALLNTATPQAKFIQQAFLIGLCSTPGTKVSSLGHSALPHTTDTLEATGLPRLSHSATADGRSGPALTPAGAIPESGSTPASGHRE
jgi:hypothetical protein